MLSDAARAVLVRARARIDTPEKWCKGHKSVEGLCRDDVPTCPAVALNAQSGPGTTEAYRAFRAQTGWAAIPDWNDAPERTHAEVLAAFDKALAS